MLPAVCLTLTPLAVFALAAFMIYKDKIYFGLNQDSKLQQLKNEFVSDWVYRKIENEDEGQFKWENASTHSLKYPAKMRTKKLL